MKIRRAADRLLLDLSQRETRVFLAMLALYPRIPPAHHRLSKSGKLPDADANQRLLDDALAEQRAETRKQLQSLVADPKRFRKTDQGGRLKVTHTEADWLLQVLNDVRVGSWVLLGSPEEKLEAALLNKGTARLFWEMEMAGYFQMHLLAALAGEG